MILLAIPFFVLVDELMNAGGLSRRIVNFALPLIEHRHGRLGYVAITAAVIMGSPPGSAVGRHRSIARLWLAAMIISVERHVRAQPEVGKGLSYPMQCLNSACAAVFDMAEEECPVCGRYQGKINVRHAGDQRVALKRRYDQAVQGAQTRGVSDKIALLEQGAMRAEIVCTVGITAAGNIFRNKKYLNYYHRDFQGVAPSQPQDRSRRHMVDARLFTADRPEGYGQFLHCFALTIDGEALTTYGGGGVAIYMADSSYLRRNASLLEMNSFHFFRTFGLGNLTADEPEGYRARWADRAWIAVAKLGPALRANTTATDIGRLLLKTGATRDQDEFIEVHVYDERGLPIKDVKRVQLRTVAATPEEQEAWRHVTTEALRLGISVS